MSEKGKPLWTRHDLDAISDPRIAVILSEFGLEGYGMFWGVIEYLGRTESICAPYDQAGCNRIAFALRTEGAKIARFLELCFSIGVFKKDETLFWSDRLGREIGIIAEKSKKASASAKSRWEKDKLDKRTQSERRANAIPDSTVQTVQYSTDRQVYSSLENQFKKDVRTFKAETWIVYLDCQRATKANTTATEKSWGFAFDRRNPDSSEFDAISQYLTEYAKIAKQAKDGDFVPSLPNPEKFFAVDGWTAALPTLASVTSAYKICGHCNGTKCNPGTRTPCTVCCPNGWPS